MPVQWKKRQRAIITCKLNVIWQLPASSLFHCICNGQSGISVPHAQPTSHFFFLLTKPVGAHAHKLHPYLQTWGSNPYPLLKIQIHCCAAPCSVACDPFNHFEIWVNTNFRVIERTTCCAARWYEFPLRRGLMPLSAVLSSGGAHLTFSFFCYERKPRGSSRRGNFTDSLSTPPHGVHFLVKSDL
jgi:hypothetical protein